MASNKIGKFVELLYRKTIENTQRWGKTATANEFTTAFPNYSVTISPYVDDWNSTSFRIFIYNSDGEMIDDITQGDVADQLKNPSDIFRELYEHARMQAMGVDAALDEMISDLEVPF